MRTHVADSALADAEKTKGVININKKKMYFFTVFYFRTLTISSRVS